MEAMSAGCLCVHPNYGALPETSAGFTWMYQYREDIRDHMVIFYSMLDKAINDVMTENVQISLETTKSYIDTFYNWDRRTEEWENFLTNILREKKLL
jgi:hypothetical protein